MSRYSITTHRDKETGKVVCYLFAEHWRKSGLQEDGTIVYGQAHLYGRNDFIKMYNADDAITFLNYLNDQSAENKIQ